MIFDSLLEKRNNLENPTTDLADPANWLLHAFGAAPTATNILVSEKTATQITAFWSAVNTISDTLAELPLKLIRVNADGTSANVTRHPALRVLRNPNPMMTPVTYRAMQQAATLTWGNSYAYVVRNALGNPVEIWPLPPNETKSVVKNRELFFDTRLDIGNTRLRSDEVIHVPALSRNGINGMSIIAEQREMLGSALAQQNFGARFFSNGAKPGGILSYPGKVRDKEAVRKAIEQVAGGENSHATLVLEGGAKYEKYTVPPEDAQFLQTREFSVDEIGRMFRLPLHFLNKMGQATFNNLEMMGTHFVQYTMMPWIIRWEQELTRKLLTQGEIDRGLRFKFNVAALIRGDIKTRSEVYAKAVQWGWMTRNEVRALEDMNPLDELDEPLQPLNMVPAGTEPVEDPAPDPEPDDDEDEETEGDEDRTYLMTMSAVTRLARQEDKAVRRFWKRGDEAGLMAFYDKHAERMVENLAIDGEMARQYCQRQLERLATDDDTETVFADITTTNVARLVNQIEESR